MVDLQLEGPGIESFLSWKIKELDVETKMKFINDNGLFKEWTIKMINEYIDTYGKI